MSKELFYVGIKNKVELRRNILEASRDVISALKEHEQIKAASKRKAEKLEDLRNLMKEIYSLDNKLSQVLPHIQVPESASRPAKQEKQTTISTKEISKDIPKAEPKKRRTELERLEEDLLRIEGKLSQLGV